LLASLLLLAFLLRLLECDVLGMMFTSLLFLVFPLLLVSLLFLASLLLLVSWLFLVVMLFLAFVNVARDPAFDGI
jgi:hypothetical protein